MTEGPDKNLFDRRLVSGTKNIFGSAKELFDPPVVATTHQTLTKFAATLDALVEPALEVTPVMDDTLEHSCDSVRQFLKAGSQIYGSISMSLQHC
jgi:late competence protein required for DNA uptake (superfamily II DNA/RNA helicase)